MLRSAERPGLADCVGHRIHTQRPFDVKSSILKWRLRTLRRLRLISAFESVCHDLGLEPECALGPSRKPKAVEARRQLAALLAERGHKSPEVGLIVGRHHATVLYHQGRLRKSKRRAA